MRSLPIMSRVSSVGVGLDRAPVSHQLRWRDPGVFAKSFVWSVRQRANFRDRPGMSCKRLQHRCRPDPFDEYEDDY